MYDVLLDLFLPIHFKQVCGYKQEQYTVHKRKRIESNKGFNSIIVIIPTEEVKKEKKVQLDPCTTAVILVG